MYNDSAVSKALVLDQALQQQPRMLLFPCNHTGNHWVLAVVQPSQRDGYLTLLDPLMDEEDKKRVPSGNIILEKVKAFLIRFEGAEVVATTEAGGGCSPMRSWHLKAPVDMVGWFPSQTNGVDCGLFVVMYMLTLLKSRGFPESSVWSFHSLSVRQPLYALLVLCRQELTSRSAPGLTIENDSTDTPPLVWVQDGGK